MSFNGFPFISHAMVAKEVHTLPSIKDLIVAAASADDLQ
jgi:enoyl reductase-like protein